MKGPVESQMEFRFNGLSKDGVAEKASLLVSIDSELNTIKVVVDMDSLPQIDWRGFEVVVDFSLKGFENNQTFFTDSNGLEMQQRWLNYRPTWDLIHTNYKDSLENVTANYFPINSAISMVDVNNGKKFTVMNDRPQSGSALHEGGVQFMQNRRIPDDDGRGMGEWVNEMDQWNNGIRVKATYHVDIYHPGKNCPMKQRLMQQKVDNPA